MVFGVGLIGAGPGAAALHAPTLARLTDFALVHVSDAGSGRADDLARLHAVRASRGEVDLLADGDVDVIAVCSPPERHAEQILAAVRAGVRGILCEKPLALTRDDAIRVVDACRAAGTALVIGTNHHFDPSWGRAVHHLVAGGREVRAISVTASLPPNGRYHSAVSEPAARPPAAPPPRPELADPETAAALVRTLVLGLVVHDLPLLRDLAPRIDRVVFARPIPPIGVVVGLCAGAVAIQVLAALQAGGADALWRMTVATDSDVLEVSFPPAFVHARSAHIRVHSVDGRVCAYDPAGEDGYLAEWGALAAALRGDVPVEYDEILADALYAIDLADSAATAAREGAGS